MPIAGSNRAIADSSQELSIARIMIFERRQESDVRQQKRKVFFGTFFATEKYDHLEMCGGCCDCNPLES
jgi:hypothetical protein